MAEIELIELTQGEVRSLSGQERGVAARAKWGLDALDESGEQVIVHARGLEAVTPSFLQGMFSKSIRRWGGREGFLSRYRFDADSGVLMQLDKAITNTLINRQNLFS